MEMEKDYKNFNDYRFAGLEYESASNKYYTMNRISKDESRIVVKVGASHLIETKFGYALILNHDYVVFLKDWQVNQSFYGNEVIIDKKYWLPKQWGCHENFGYDEENLIFENWLKTAKLQQSYKDELGLPGNPVRWEK